MAIKYIMGIQSFSNMDSGAALVKFSDDGKVLDFIAISEERLIRVKYPYVFPVFSIGYCMDHFDLNSFDQIDFLVTDYIRIKRWFNSGPSYNISDFDYLKRKFDVDPNKIRVIGHHLAHAASTYYTSGFDDAAILIADGNGSDLETTSYYDGEGFDIRFLENYRFHGIGALYGAVTKNILNFGTGGEGKTMGLAPYGAEFSPALKFDTKLDGIKNSYSMFMKRMPYSDVLNQMDSNNRINPLRGDYKKCTNKEQLLEPYFARVAFDVQKETERVLVHLADDLKKKTRKKNLCIAGGVGLNSVSNKIILDKCDFENVFIFPACSDSGIPLGLALWGYYNLEELGDFKRKKLGWKHAYTGMEYSEDCIKKLLSKYDIPHAHMTLEETAKLISQGNIVGWYQGGSEYGPRALGHRSILADSRQAKMKDKINLRVKHRELFRPFAPSIIYESTSEYFDLDRESPYMLLIAEVKKPTSIPSVTHVDNTARVQTVTKEANGIYYDLISEFGKLTGVPCVLNTSFNDAGEPIVETPEDAVICFLRTDMDYLVLGKHMIDATKLERKRLLDQLLKEREAKIKTRREELLKKYFKGYDDHEKTHYVSEMNKISEWYTKYKCKYELEKKVLEWAEEKRKILIVGTKSHTAILPNFINEFWNVDVVGFIKYEGDAEDNDVKLHHKEYDWEDLDIIGFDEILISSFEYNFEIEHFLKKKGVKKPVYTIYDNTSRDFLDVLTVFPEFKLK